MATINNIINQSSSWLYSEFLALIRILTDGWAGLVILVVILIILATVSKKIKISVWQEVISATKPFAASVVAMTVKANLFGDNSNRTYVTELKLFRLAYGLPRRKLVL